MKKIVLIYGKTIITSWSSFWVELRITNCNTYLILQGFNVYHSWFFDRLLGVALVAPVLNYFGMPSFPDNLLKEALRMLPKSDRWTLRVAHYAPWLFYWWRTQKWFPTLTPVNLETLPHEDIEAIKSLPEDPNMGQVT